jgi:hypothetical protein
MLDLMVNYVTDHIDLLKVIIYPIILIIGESNLVKLHYESPQYGMFFLLMAYMVLIIDSVFYTIKWQCYNLLMIIVISQVANCACRYYMKGGFNGWMYLNDMWYFPTNVSKIDVIVIAGILLYTWAITFHLN